MYTHLPLKQSEIMIFYFPESMGEAENDLMNESEDVGSQS
jgi:hypothetical protein